MFYFEGNKVVFNWLLLSWFSIISVANVDNVYDDNKTFPFILKIGSLQVSISERIILKSRVTKENEFPLFAELGVTLPKNVGLPLMCKVEKKIERLSFTWDENMSLEIKKLNSFCHDVVWNTSGPAVDCFNYGKMNWYGGSQYVKQYWPVEKLKIYHQPFIPLSADAASVSEPLWINSKGLLIFVPRSVPLFVDSNNYRNNSLCLISNATSPYNPRSHYKLKYTICQLDDPRKAREYAFLQNFIDKPLDIPDERMIKYPVWSTWVKFKKDINDTSVLKFAEDIVKYGFNNSQIEIDDNWETCYGSMEFNKTRFPDMKSLSNKLKKLGFRITIWRHPFVNTNCPNYSLLKASNFFIKNASGYDVAVWWDGKAGVFDLTNLTVKKWFQNKHRDFLYENGIDGFKFDAGEIDFLPVNPVLHGDPDLYPSSFSIDYIDTVTVFGKIIEARVGHRSQRYPIYIRMIDKNSLWDYNGGLPTLITTCLLMNFIGYPWVLPDMVGGNAYENEITEELFIRWLQANTFMPVIQLSVAPWDFNNNNVVKITKKFTSLHLQYSDKIIELMKNTVENGAPINAPIWWVDPKNPVAHSIDSEYMLGEDVLVAPVLEEGARDRDVYLPKGLWKDGNNESVLYKGPLWIRKYPADLFTLPFFIRTNSSKINL